MAVRKAGQLSFLKRTPLLTWSAVVLSTHLAACTAPCDLCTTSAVVFGTVTDVDGTPVAGAEVSVEVFRSACTGFGFESGTVATGESGSYRHLIVQVIAPQQVCLIVNTLAPADSRLSPAADTGATVRLTADFDRGEPFDSVRVDLVLPASHARSPYRL